MKEERSKCWTFEQQLKRIIHETLEKCPAPLLTKKLAYAEIKRKTKE